MGEGVTEPAESRLQPDWPPHDIRNMRHDSCLHWRGEDREALDRDQESDDTEGGESQTHQDFGGGREIAVTVARQERDRGRRVAVEHAADAERQQRFEQQIGSGANCFEAQGDGGKQDQGELGQEECAVEVERKRLRRAVRGRLNHRAARRSTGGPSTM